MRLGLASMRILLPALLLYPLLLAFASLNMLPPPPPPHPPSSLHLTPALAASILDVVRDVAKDVMSSVFRGPAPAPAPHGSAAGGASGASGSSRDVGGFADDVRAAAAGREVRPSPGPAAEQGTQQQQRAAGGGSAAAPGKERVVGLREEREEAEERPPLMEAADLGGPRDEGEAVEALGRGLGKVGGCTPWGRGVCAGCRTLHVPGGHPAPLLAALHAPCSDLCLPPPPHASPPAPLAPPLPRPLCRGCALRLWAPSRARWTR